MHPSYIDIGWVYADGKQGNLKPRERGVLLGGGRRGALAPADRPLRARSSCRGEIAPMPSRWNPSDHRREVRAPGPPSRIHDERDIPATPAGVPIGQPEMLYAAGC
jgi:hypothetical protein